MKGTILAGSDSRKAYLLLIDLAIDALVLSCKRLDNEEFYVGVSHGAAVSARTIALNWNVLS